MSIKNLIKHKNKFAEEYIATIVSNDDPLRRGRLQVTIPTILGSFPFWVNATLTGGSVRLLLIPEPNDTVTVKFKNKDVYSGEWELKGSPSNTANIDPKKYGLQDNQGNSIIIDRATNSISINSKAVTIIADDTYVRGNFGTSVGATEMVPLPNGIVLSFVNGIFIGSS